MSRPGSGRALGRLTGRLAVLLAAGAVLGSPAAAQPTGITLPPGFEIRVFASGLGAPRALALDPSGTLLVSVPSRGQVLALPDRDGDGRADSVETVAGDLDRPHGLAFRTGHLYVADTGRVLRFRYDAAIRAARDPVVVVPDLPAGGHHWTRSLAFGPDGRLYVAVGSSCDVCREADRRRASIVRYNADGSAESLFATGLRNVVGLAFQPATGALWATVNERDWRAGGAPPDYVTVVRERAFYGWPDCYAIERRLLPDPELKNGRPCGEATVPTLEIPPHSAPLGLAFYTSHQFPPAYRGSLFVAYHGSRAGLPPTGYKVVRVGFGNGRPSAIEDFATGWLQGNRVIGRPVDVVIGADGALYVSDDHAGRVYRVVFQEQSSR